MKINIWNASDCAEWNTIVAVFCVKLNIASRFATGNIKVTLFANNISKTY